MNRAIVCLAEWLANLRCYGTVGERHAVARPIGLGVVAVLIVGCVVLWLVAWDLVMREKHIALILRLRSLPTATTKT